MSRFVIRDHQWVRMEPHCLGLKAHPGRTVSDSRLFMKVVFWIARTGPPWRDLRMPPRQATGTSKGRWTTKISALTDVPGYLIRFVLLPGNRYDTVGVAPFAKSLKT